MTVLGGMRAPWPAPDYQRMLDDANRAWAAAQPRLIWAPPIVREVYDPRITWAVQAIGPERPLPPLRYSDGRLI
ncbi:hypothetical protein ACWFLT_20660 [Bacillus velezensis]